MRLHTAHAAFLPKQYQARCKSGYTFNGKPCRRMCSRHEIMCADCQSAIVVVVDSPAGFMARLANRVREMKAGLQVRTAEVR